MEQKKRDNCMSVKKLYRNNIFHIYIYTNQFEIPCAINIELYFDETLGKKAGVFSGKILV